MKCVRSTGGVRWTCSCLYTRNRGKFKCSVRQRGTGVEDCLITLWLRLSRKFLPSRPSYYEGLRQPLYRSIGIPVWIHDRDQALALCAVLDQDVPVNTGAHEDYCPW